MTRVWPGWDAQTKISQVLLLLLQKKNDTTGRFFFRSTHYSVNSLSRMNKTVARGTQNKYQVVSKCYAYCCKRQIRPLLFVK